jgi:hypothetical protein
MDAENKLREIEEMMKIEKLVECENLKTSLETDFELRLESQKQSYFSKVQDLELRLRDQEDMCASLEDQLREKTASRTLEDKDLNSKLVEYAQMIEELREQVEEQKAVNGLLKQQLNEKFS